MNRITEEHLETLAALRRSYVPGFNPAQTRMLDAAAEVLGAKVDPKDPAAGWHAICRYADRHAVQRFVRLIRDYDARGDAVLRDQAKIQALEYVDTRLPRNLRDWAESQIKTA